MYRTWTYMGKIIAISYADKKYRFQQKFNTKQALRYGADIVKEYGPESLSDEFKSKYWDILKEKRGCGYWIWKPYILLKTLNEVDDGDYIVYTDAGSAFVGEIKQLIDVMESEKTDIMAFSITYAEKQWTKRDAFIELNCDKPEMYESPQICGGYIIVKKSLFSRRVLNEYMEACSNRRINTDDENVLGKDNYEGFRENRHDQSAWSLIIKKNGIKPFRDPSQYGNDYKKFSEDVVKRSNYPQMIESYRNQYISHEFELDYFQNKLWCRVMRKLIFPFRKVQRRVLHKVILRKE